MWVALVSALMGGALTVLGVVLQWHLSRKDEARKIKQQAQLDLVREIVRNRMNQTLVALALNEVPMLFADDPEALRLYRSIIFNRDPDAMTGILRDLLVHLTKAVGMPAMATTDIERGLTTPNTQRL